MCLGIISFLLGILSVSIFSLVAISLDRYCAICHPILYHKRTGSLKATKPIIAICWLLGILGYFPLFGWNVGMRENKCHPSVVLSFEYIMFLCVAAAFVPATAIIVIYSLIFKEINVQVKTNANQSFFFFILNIFSQSYDCRFHLEKNPSRQLNAKSIRQQKLCL